MGGMKKKITTMLTDNPLVLPILIVMCQVAFALAIVAAIALVAVIVVISKMTTFMSAFTPLNALLFGMCCVALEALCISAVLDSNPESLKYENLLRFIQCIAFGSLETFYILFSCGRYLEIFRQDFPHLQRTFNVLGIAACILCYYQAVPDFINLTVPLMKPEMCQVVDFVAYGIS
ncbi:hypothetical protein BC830DRAFT_1110759 [Chytriomyces sp. MP71]|nr:hypothetical protein BC830DRAFT_1110759 [Chytriomyces sp. MP71]